MDESLYPRFFRIETEHWWFAARQKILMDLLLTRTAIPDGARLLDVGCGTGALLSSFSKRFKAFGQDLSPQAVEFCRRRGLQNTFCGPLHALPGDLRPFDVVTALDVIEHIDDDLDALRQIHALLRPGGMLLVTVPAFAFLWGPHDVLTHHRRRYVRSSLRLALRQSGFSVTWISYFNFLLFPVAVVRRLSARISHSTEASDFVIPPSPVNRALTALFASERWVLRRAGFPFGLSLIAIARRDC